MTKILFPAIVGTAIVTYLIAPVDKSPIVLVFAVLVVCKIVADWGGKNA